MTSKIKVDNIENQCGGAVVTKCGATTTISGSVVKADDIQAADGGNLINQCGTTITLGASGDTINLASGASQSGFGRTGTVDWITTPKTATFTAVSGEGYFCNTSGGAFTANLPAGVAGAIVSFADYAGTWQTNNLTISPNGTDKIGSLNQNATGNVEGQSITFVFVDSTQGWINTMDSTSNVRGNIEYITASVSGACNTLETVDTNFKIATFTGPGTFTVCSVSTVDATRNKIDYVVVGGGGGGGSYTYGAGAGGGGGFRESYTAAVGGPYTASPLATPTSLPVAATGYPVTVGAGGSGAPAPGGPSCGNNGSNSVFAGTTTITSTGGGRGGGGTNELGQPGGSGGGGGGASAGASPTAAGAGNTPPVSPSQGNSGGTGIGNPTPAAGNRRGGGGGGAGSAGSAATIPAGSSSGGGAGVTTGAKSSPATTPTGPGGYSGGAGGSGGAGPYNGTPGGFGSGSSGFGAAGAGAANSGGGGGASGANGSVSTGGAGGSGVVVIRYRFQ